MTDISGRPIGDIINQHWVPTGSHTRCPQCLSVPGMYVTLATDAYNEAHWFWKCFDCGATGTAQLKTPEEKGKWVDGLDPVAPANDPG